MNVSLNLGKLTVLNVLKYFKSEKQIYYGKNSKNRLVYENVLYNTQELKSYLFKSINFESCDDIKNEKYLQSIKIKSFKSDIQICSVATYENYIFFGNSKGSISIYDLNNCKLVYRKKSHNSDVVSLKIVIKLNHIWLISADKIEKVIIWKIYKNRSIFNINNIENKNTKVHQKSESSYSLINIKNTINYFHADNHNAIIIKEEQIIFMSNVKDISICEFSDLFKNLNLRTEIEISNLNDNSSNTNKSIKGFENTYSIFLIKENDDEIESKVSSSIDSNFVVCKSSINENCDIADYLQYFEFLTSNKTTHKKSNRDKDLISTKFFSYYYLIITHNTGEISTYYINYLMEFDNSSLGFNKKETIYYQIYKIHSSEISNLCTVYDNNYKKQVIISNDTKSGFFKFNYIKNSNEGELLIEKFDYEEILNDKNSFNYEKSFIKYKRNDNFADSIFTFFTDSIIISFSIIEIGVKSLIAISLWNGEILIYDLQTYSKIWMYKNSSSITQAFYSETAKLYLIYDFNNNLKAINLITEIKISSIFENPNEIQNDYSYNQNNIYNSNTNFNSINLSFINYNYEYITVQNDSLICISKINDDIYPSSFFKNNINIYEIL